MNIHAQLTRHGSRGTLQVSAPTNQARASSSWSIPGHSECLSPTAGGGLITITSLVKQQQGRYQHSLGQFGQ
jgi:hypothetical protein